MGAYCCGRILLWAHFGMGALWAHYGRSMGAVWAHLRMGAFAYGRICVWAHIGMGAFAYGRILVWAHLIGGDACGAQTLRLGCGA